MAHRESSQRGRPHCRSIAAALATTVATLLAGPQDTQAAVQRPQLTIVVPGELRVGSHIRLLLRLSLPAGTAEPLLITPFREGEAIEVVRGRLLRSDARPIEGGLELELPLRTHSAGTAVLGARVQAYVCEQACKRIIVEARTNIVVLPP